MAEFEDFEVTGSTVDTTAGDLHKGGGGAVSKAGFYHGVIDSVQYKPATEEGKAHILCTFTTWAASPKDAESEIGKKYFHRLYINPPEGDTPEKTEEKRVAHFKGLLTFLYEHGVISQDEAFGKESFTITKEPFMRLESCQSIFKIDKLAAREYIDKKTGQKKMGKDSFQAYSNNFWNLNDPHVKDVPRDWEMAQQAPVITSDAQMAADIDDV